MDIVYYYEKYCHMCELKDEKPISLTEFTKGILEGKIILKDFIGGEDDL